MAVVLGLERKVVEEVRLLRLVGRRRAWVLERERKRRRRVGWLDGAIGGRMGRARRRWR